MEGMASHVSQQEILKETLLMMAVMVVVSKRTLVTCLYKHSQRDALLIMLCGDCNMKGMASHMRLLDASLMVGRQYGADCFYYEL